MGLLCNLYSDLSFGALHIMFDLGAGHSLHVSGDV